MPDYIYLLENRLSPAQQNAIGHVRDAAREAGMTVFLTGGAVRDLTSGLPVRDLDFSVQGNALKLRKSLEKAGAEFWGDHEPSRTLFFWFPGSVRVEISSARREEYPKPGKPIYHWAPILEDLRRRDFTANAMAISLNEGSWGLLLDPLNGFADIEARHLRLASSYGFIEDPSRLIRATRFTARTGWEMDERTKQRYQNAKDEGLLDQISLFAKGYELEEIAHEEDPLRVLRALESEGWMKVLCPAWTSARADVKGLEELNTIFIRLLVLGVTADPSAAHIELLTAKMPPKDVAGLKRLFPRRGFVEQWNHIEQSAKDFSKELLSKAASTPSAAWKLLVSYQPEAVLWAAFSSKSGQVREKFDNFFNVWPEARQKIPAALMAEMRITPELPQYGNVVEALFFQFMDSKLTTDEEIRAFLQPYSPPAPPPPVIVRRSRGRRAEPKIEEEEESELPIAGGEDEAAEEESETEEIPLRGSSVALLPGKKVVGKLAVKAGSKPHATPPSAAVKRNAAAPGSHGQGVAKATTALPAPPLKAAKTAAKTPSKSVPSKSAVKSLQPKQQIASKKPENPVRSAPKPAAGKQASAPVRKPAKPAKAVAVKPKKTAKSAKKVQKKKKR